MRIRTMGGLELEQSTFGRSKPLLLLTYVALEGSTSRRELADLFFMHTKNPRDSLSTALRQLRAEVEHYLELPGGRVRTTIPCDAVELLAKLDEGSDRDAVELYAGPFLRGIDLELHAELEEWIFGTREAIAAHVRAAHMRLAEAAVRQGDESTAARCAVDALDVAGAPPTDPSMLARMYALLLVGRSGRLTEVRREAEDFGIELPASADDARSILGLSDAVERWEDRAPSNLPEPTASFFGREQELEELRTALNAKGGRVVSILGPGGAGKTRLALEAAHDQRSSDRFPDGIWFVALESLSSYEHVMASVADTLPVPDAGSPVSAVTSWIGPRRMLLVLDNFEHVLDAAPTLAELVAVCPGLHVLITSRERLNIREERSIVIDGLPVPEASAGVDRAKECASVQLFLERGQQAKHDFTIDDANVGSVIAVCSMVAGVPLGIELAASSLRIVPVSHVEEELRAGLDVLSSGPRDAPARHQSIRATLDHSWNLLTQRQRMSLRNLSVFRGGFSRLAAAEVGGATFAVLVALVDKSLVRALARGRYDLHPLIHQYAWEKLLGDVVPSVETVRDRHVRYFVDLAEACAGRPEKYDAIDADYANVMLAAETAATAGRLEAYLSVFRSLSHGDLSYLDARGSTVVSTSALEQAVAAARHLEDRRTECILLEKLGFAFDQRDDYTRAIEAYSRAIHLAEDTCDRSIEAALRARVATLRFLAGGEDVGSAYDVAEDLARRSGDRFALAQVLSHRGYYAFQKREKDCEAGFQYSEEAASIAHEIGHHALRIGALLNKGGCELELGRPEKALATHQHVLELAQRQDNQQWVMHVKWSLGEDYHALGDRENAQRSLSEALILFERASAKAPARELLAFMEKGGYEVDGEVSQWLARRGEGHE